MVSKSGKRLIQAAKEAAAIARGYRDPSCAVEALASAWASIDGKLDQFLRGRKAKSETAYGGYYGGYISDAEELQRRLKARGFIIAHRPGMRDQ